MIKSLKTKIIELRKENKTYNEIAEMLDCSKGTISFHLSQASKDNQYIRIKNSRVKMRKDLKLQLGGKCTRCGYSACLAALDFHHLDCDTKLYNIGQSIDRVPISLIREEVKKCVLLCSNCHREHHAGIW